MHKDPDLVQRLEEDLFQKVDREVKSHERDNLLKVYEQNQNLYLARRSVYGLKTCGEDEGLEVPFVGAADVGSPIELTVTQELIPNIMSSHLGMTPFTETKRLGDYGMEPAGEVDHFLYYEMAYKSKIRPTRRKTVLGAYKFGEYIEKVVLEKKKRYVVGKRTLLVSGNKVLFGADKREVEVHGEATEESLLSLAYEMLSGTDDRSLKFRYAIESMHFDPRSAAEAAGIEVKGTSFRVAPLTPGVGGGPPQPDWDNATAYSPKELSIPEEIDVDHVLDISGIHPKDFIVPSDARSNNIMDFWNCHQYNVPLEWLMERREDFIADRVDLLVEKFKDTKEDEEHKKEPLIWEVWDRFVVNNSNEKEKDYLREVEIIAWFSPDLEGSPLLGCMMNPFARFPSSHIRPFFVFQVKPENDRWHGLSIPETASGLRETMDSLINGMMNRSAVYSDPITIMTPGCFDIEDNQRYGPGARWVKEANETIELLRYYTPEQQNMEIYKFLNLGIRIMWGASEHLSGFAAKTESKTLGEAHMLASKGAQMFHDTVESISQTCDLQYDFIRCLYLYSGEVGSTEFPIDDGSLEGGERKRTMRLTKKMLEGPIFIKSRRVVTETEREAGIQAILGLLNFVGQASPMMIQSPTFVQPIIKQFVDYLNLEAIRVPTVEELQQEQALIQHHQQQIAQQQRQQEIMDGAIKKEERRQADDLVEHLVSQQESRELGI